MRVLARLSYSLAVLAVLAPGLAQAGMPIVAGAPWTPAQQMATKKTSKNDQRLCADCMRKKMAKDGVSLPPAPPLPPGGVARDYKCSVCGRPAAVNAGGVAQRRRSVQVQTEEMANRAEPGHAIVGGETGYAVIGNDPMPIGVMEPRLAAAAAPVAPRGPAAGQRDPSVMTTSTNTASPSDPIMPTPERNPRILSHLFGLSAIGRDRSIARERHAEEEHARIAYGAANTEPVQNVPASAVYGR